MAAESPIGAVIEKHQGQRAAHDRDESVPRPVEEGGGYAGQHGGAAEEPAHEAQRQQGRRENGQAEGVQPPAEQHLAEPREGLADPAQGRDPDGERRTEP